jgi:acetolactate synthase I/II/III large subunit
MKVYEAIAAAIADEQVRDIFGLLGDGNMPFWSVLHHKHKLNMYSSWHEAAAVSMADGYSRATGKIGVASVTAGPGLTHAATPLIAAARSRSSLVVLTGDRPAGGPRNTGQIMNQRRFAEACEARFVPITKADYVVDEVREAFYAARVHRVPVILNIPMDVQDLEFQWDWDYTPSFQFVPSTDCLPSSPSVEKLVSALRAAEKPIIIAGRGAVLSGAKAEIERLADRVGALLATSVLGKGYFEGSPFNIGIAGAFSSAPTEQLFAEADFVLGIGAELGYFTTEGGLLFANAEVARIDILPAPDEIGILPGFYLRGDAKLTAGLVSDELEKQNVKKTGYRSAKTLEVLSQKLRVPNENASDGLDPRALMVNLSRSLPDNTQVTCGVGHFWSFPVMYLALPPGSHMRFSYAFGTIGSALPTSIGVRAGTQDCANIVIEGDGSIMQHIQELETVVRHRFQLVVIVWNDRGYGSDVHKMSTRGLDATLAQWVESPDFVAIAKAMGGDGVLLKSESEISDAVSEGLRKGGLFLIDARVSPTVMSDPYLKIYLGKENCAPLLRLSEPAGTRL